ncbi:MAG: toll/interleukin-1 receptor domain-containing protein [Thermoanaerobaculia bacterium]
MKVFISWSGDLSRALAVELRDWLPMAVHQVDAWISGRNIDPGQRWALVLGRELEQSTFAVICLTAENRQSPWILFEAGAVARSLDARVVPLLFGIMPSDLDGPLAQFQSVLADRAGIGSLVSALYEASNSGLDAHQRELVFERLWPLLEARLAALAEQAQRATIVESPTDLAADLVQSAEYRPAPLILEKNILEHLQQERQRLRRELEYLEAEEEKLTQQNAPISLLERAIEPTQHRLAGVESTLRAAFDRVFAQLTPAQLGILRGQVTPRGTRLVQPLPLDHMADAEALARLGLVTIGEHDMEIAHDLVATSVAERFGVDAAA